MIEMEGVKVIKFHRKFRKEDILETRGRMERYFQ
jgi:hypothetical protein